MIDKETFAVWMGVLADRYSRELQVPTLQAYYVALEELETDEFVVGVQRVFKRGTFFPSPQEIIDATRPAPTHELRALAAFSDAIDGRTIEDDTAKAAIRLMGGSVTLRDSTTTFTLPGMQRRFVDTYVAIARSNAERREIEQLRLGAPKVLARLVAGESVL